MSLSPDTQRAERRRLLVGMLAELQGRDYAALLFETDKDLTDVHPSAWVDVEEDGLVSRRAVMGKPGRYVLTPAGWLAAVRESGEFDSAETHARCQRLMQLLKGIAEQAEVPQHDVLLDTQYGVPSSAGLSGEWIRNALDSGLLGEKFPKHRINCYPASIGKGHYRVPSTFGRKLVE